MADFKEGWFDSDHSNIKMLDREFHQYALSQAEQISRLDGEVLDLSEKFISGQETVSGLQGALSSTQETVSDLTEGVAGLSEKFTGLSEGSANLSEKVIDLSENFANLSEKVTGPDEAMAICAVVSVGIVICLIAFCAYQALQHAKENSSSVGPKSEKTNISVTNHFQKGPLIDFS
jgi:hypothetical protein